MDNEASDESNENNTDDGSVCLDSGEFAVIFHNNGDISTYLHVEDENEDETEAKACHVVDFVMFALKEDKVQELYKKWLAKSGKLN